MILNKKTIIYLFLTVFLLLCAGCTDAAWDAEVASYNENFNVVCYSGGKVVYTAITTGRVNTLEGGGFQFRTTTGEFVRTFADCFVSFKK